MKENSMLEKEANAFLKDNDAFALMSIQNVNHVPHPYMVGPRHVAYASDKNGGMLTEEVAEKVPCATPGCNLPYSEHTSDKVVFLKLKRNVDQIQVKTILENLIKELDFKKNGIDGFSFVETDEKYRITDETTG